MPRDTSPRIYWTILAKLCLGTAILAYLQTPLDAQDAAKNSTPRIAGLTATPSAIGSDDSSSLITFTVDDPEGDYISWSVALQSTGDGDLADAGELSAQEGTDASGALVQLTFTAPSTWNPVTVLLTVQATDGHGGWAAPKWIAIPVAPGGLGRSP